MTTPSGRVLTVGAGQQFSTLNTALAASQDGDLIAVQAGTYTDDISTVTHSVTIQGVGGLAHLVSTQNIANEKAILIDDAADLTIENMEFSGATVAESNGAGIRYEAGNLTVINSYFHDNQDGILGGAIAGGTVSITGSTFTHNGDGDGQTHGVYLGMIANLTVTNSFFQDQLGGSDVKSRAATTLIANNKFVDTALGDTNYQVDLPNGGNATVENNLVLKSAHAENRAIVHFGGEISNPVGSLVVQGNQLYSQYGDASAILNQTNLPVSLVNNGIEGTVSILVDGNPATATVQGNSVIGGADPSSTLELPGAIDGTVTVAGVAAGTAAIAPANAPSPSFVAGATSYALTDGVPQTLSGLTGENAITVSGAGGTISATSGHTMLSILDGVTGPTNFSAFGGDHTVTAAAGNNTLLGIGGNDIFSVTGGDNVLAVGNGNNLLSAVNGNDTMMSGSGADTLSSGGTGNHMIVAGTGYSQIAAGGSSDLVFGGGGKAQVTLGWGADSIVAGSGDTTISGGDGPVLVALGTGTVIMQTGQGLTGLLAQGGDTILHVSDGGGSVVLAGYDPTHTEIVVPHAINGLQLTDTSQIPMTHDSQGDTVLYLGSNSHGAQFVVLVGVADLDPTHILLS